MFALTNAKKACESTAAVIPWQDAGTTAVIDLTSAVNSVLRAAGEGSRMSRCGVGAALTSLGLTDRRRTNTGWVLRLIERHKSASTN